MKTSYMHRRRMEMKKGERRVQIDMRREETRYMDRRRMEKRERGVQIDIRIEGDKLHG